MGCMDVFFFYLFWVGGGELCTDMTIMYIYCRHSANAHNGGITHHKTPQTVLTCNGGNLSYVTSVWLMYDSHVT